jgi:hypothetical protein
VNKKDKRTVCLGLEILQRARWSIFTGYWTMVTVISTNLFQVNASKDDSLNQGNNEEVHRQEIAKESSGQVCA